MGKLTVIVPPEGNIEAVVKVTVTVPLCRGTFWVTVMLAPVT